MKTSELTGFALDWAVAKCEGVELYSGPRDNNPAYKANWVRRKHGDLYQPSTDWSQAGPIIEREWIDLHCVNDSLWEAECPAVGGLAMQNGPTPLEAAMRCYVASKLGDEVEIPREIAQ
jgi:hypothetical protein